MTRRACPNCHAPCDGDWCGCGARVRPDPLCARVICTVVGLVMLPALVVGYGLPWLAVAWLAGDAVEEVRADA